MGKSDYSTGLKPLVAGNGHTVGWDPEKNVLSLTKGTPEDTRLVIPGLEIPEEARVLSLGLGTGWEVSPAASGYSKDATVLMSRNGDEKEEYWLSDLLVAMAGAQVPKINKRADGSTSSDPVAVMVLKDVNGEDQCLVIRPEPENHITDPTTLPGILMMNLVQSMLSAEAQSDKFNLGVKDIVWDMEHAEEDLKKLRLVEPVGIFNVLKAKNLEPAESFERYDLMRGLCAKLATAMGEEVVIPPAEKEEAKPAEVVKPVEMPKPVEAAVEVDSKDNGWRFDSASYETKGRRYKIADDMGKIFVGTPDNHYMRGEREEEGEVHQFYKGGHLVAKVVVPESADKTVRKGIISIEPSIGGGFFLYDEKPNSSKAGAFKLFKGTWYPIDKVVGWEVMGGEKGYYQDSRKEAEAVVQIRNNKGEEVAALRIRRDSTKKMFIVEYRDMKNYPLLYGDPGVRRLSSSEAATVPEEESVGNDWRRKPKFYSSENVEEAIHCTQIIRCLEIGTPKPNLFGRREMVASATGRPNSEGELISRLVVPNALDCAIKPKHIEIERIKGSWGYTIRNVSGNKNCNVFYLNGVDKWEPLHHEADFCRLAGGTTVFQIRDNKGKEALAFFVNREAGSADLQFGFRDMQKKPLSSYSGELYEAMRLKKARLEVNEKAEKEAMKHKKGKMFEVGEHSDYEHGYEVAGKYKELIIGRAHSLEVPANNVEEMGEKVLVSVAPYSEWIAENELTVVVKDGHFWATDLKNYRMGEIRSVYAYYKDSLGKWRIFEHTGDYQEIAPISKKSVEFGIRDRSQTELEARLNGPKHKIRVSLSEDDNLRVEW